MEAVVEMSPDALRLDLADFWRIDWPTVWAGPPLPVDPGFEEWCARFGWKPQTVENDLKVLTRHGTLWKLSARGLWRPVVQVDQGMWRLETSVKEEEEEVVAAGVAAWEEYVRAVSEVWGEPSWSGGAGDEDFPDSPAKGMWRKPNSAQGNPYRLAFWVPPVEDTGPVVVLIQGVAHYTWEPVPGAGSSIRISLRPAAERGEHG
ncbi:hypothetical protein [Nocardiopsis halotolerans]|uniref:hypothetical protein n=1 Tax=Nocardiopsis halotolerans TaxID=124252 RepID=UPI001268E635|nr:hypothetical protein [Nocardiopsis halotolerans]